MRFSQHIAHHAHHASPASPASPLLLNKTLGLGIDAGGTQTRWALAHPSGHIIGSGQVDGLSALQMATPGGQQIIRKTLSNIADTVLSFGAIGRIEAGITGYGDDTQHLRDLLGAVFRVPTKNVNISNDIVIAYRSVFTPGEGYLVYAGTGSIAAYIDEQGVFHRAGGHGFLLDDAGSGFWIAREALRQIWRNEDEQTGIWHDSIMAQKVFAQIGASDWPSSKEFIYQGTRGEIGKLALAVAAAADLAPTAYHLLQNAGRELARLAMALCQRFGDKPVALGGRVQELHPVIYQTLRATLPDTISLQACANQAHFAAAHSAAQSSISTSS